MSEENEIVEEYGDIVIRKTSDRYILQYIVKEIYEPRLPYLALEPLIKDDNLEEIVYNGPDKYVKVYHRRYGICETNIMLSEKDIMRVLTEIGKYVGRKISHERPLFDARLPDGSRINATIPPVSPDGPTLTIRKFTKDPLTIIDLIKNGTINSCVGAYLWLWVEGLKYKPSNIIIAGGSSSGKTTTLNTLAMFIPVEERLITIEDTAELQLEHEHWVRMESVPPTRNMGEISMDALLKNALRMRPDRIIIGEIRGSEANTLFTAMNTGHDGCMSTLHANTTTETIIRLTTPPMNVEPLMLTALDLIIMQQRVILKSKAAKRRIVEISEVTGLEKNRPRMNTIFRWDPATNALKETGIPSKLREEISTAANITLKEFDEILNERQNILDGMVLENYRDVKTVSTVMQNYYLKRETGNENIKIPNKKIGKKIR